MTDDSTRNSEGGAPGVGADRSSPGEERSILEMLAEKAGDPGLFPAEVLRLHGLGKARRARAALLEHAGNERNKRRAQLQLEAAAYLRAWLDPVKEPRAGFTLNGFGTRLLGSYAHEPDGTFIKTKWITALFIPVWPLVSYLVARAEPRKRAVLPGTKSGGWYFLGRTPHPPETIMGRRFALGGMAVFAALVAFASYRAGTRTDLYVYNGFERHVWASVGGRTEVLEPGGHFVQRSLSLEPVEVSASWGGGEAPFEQLTADLTEHGNDLVVYNVGGRGLLGLSYIGYTDSETERDAAVPDPIVLGAGPISPVVQHTDYEFEEPPDSISLSSPGVTTRTLLAPLDDPQDPQSAVLGLTMMGMPERALRLVEARLRAMPDDGALVEATATSVFPDDLDARKEFARGLIANVSETVELHRAYQNLWPEDDRSELREEYGTLAVENPESAMYQYLAGRVQGLGSAAEARYYDAAMKADPDYSLTQWGLAHRALHQRQWARTLEHFDRRAELDTSEETTEYRIRLRTLLGRDEENAALLESLIEANPDDFGAALRRAHHRVAVDLEAAGSAAAALLPLFGRLSRQPVSSTLAEELRLTIAITAGDLDEARGFLAATPADRRSVDMAFRLAFSDGAGAEDLSLLRDIPEWWRYLHPLDLLIALPALDATEREQAEVTLDGVGLTEVIEVLNDPRRLRDPSALERSMSPRALQLRAHASFAAAHRLSVLDGAGGMSRAQQRHREIARSLALPGELPYTRR